MYEINLGNGSTIRVNENVSDQLRGRPMRFTLDGATVDVDHFISINDFDADESRAILAMVPGEESVYGGGAAPIFVLRRES